MKQRVIEVMELLMEQHPEYKKELTEVARLAYEAPLTNFCENEAFFLLTSCFCLDQDDECFDIIADELKTELLMDDYVVNWQLCQELTRMVLQNHSIIINSFIDIAHAKIKPQPYINLKDSSMDLLTYMLCMEYGISDLDLQMKISQGLQNRYFELQYISYKKFKEGFELEIKESCIL